MTEDYKVGNNDVERRYERGIKEVIVYQVDRGVVWIRYTLRKIGYICWVK